jgi:formamidopyrimidine-DNA glycosylase
MPELPEIVNLADQMRATLTAKRITGVELAQPKCLNIPPDTFRSRVLNKRIGTTSARGKWLFTRLEPSENLMLNLGMGGDLLYHNDAKTVPKKRQFRLTFSDATELTATFWWFGYVHLSSDQDLPRHSMTARLGISPIEEEFTLDRFSSMLSGRRGAIKSYLMAQKNIAGIGNVYIQDILFGARIHPLREIQKLTPVQIRGLHRSIRSILSRSIRLGGLKYERDLHGQNGRFGPGQFKVGYKTGKPCPSCGTKVKKIRTGSTASYICPKCQRR